ncbi:MAG: 16S rRNA (adenine(1518)-N(6)/adenine(1519)-N(6))-dimethyltransferase RsmA [bacterium]
MGTKKSLELNPPYQFARAKKALGQNFLKSGAALAKIIDAGNISAGDTVLEIGPGRGALTGKILAQCAAKGATLVAVEKDGELFAMLSERFAAEIRQGILSLREGDILDADIDALVGRAPYKIIANIPYNITGAILKKFLTAQHQPETMILMVQHEVAQRILARDGKESLLSISVKAYGEPRMVAKVPARYFSPAPKVDSAVIAIEHISKKNFTPARAGVPMQVGEEKFWRIVHAGFAHKRKKLAGNLKNLFSHKKELLEDLGNARAEEFSLSQWLELISRA